MDVEKLLPAWNSAFGKRPILAAALHWQARNGNVAIAAALGHPLPSVKSLGRLLASNAGITVCGLRLVQCPGRVGNSAVWAIEPAPQLPPRGAARIDPVSPERSQ